MTTTGEKLSLVGFVLYQIAGLWTFVFLTFLDGYGYNWWNWIIALPVNLFVGEIWPIYCLFLRLIFAT